MLQTVSCLLFFSFCISVSNVLFEYVSLSFALFHWVYDLTRGWISLLLQKVLLSFTLCRTKGRTKILSFLSLSLLSDSLCLFMKHTYTSLTPHENEKEKRRRTAFCCNRKMFSRSLSLMCPQYKMVWQHAISPHFYLTNRSVLIHIPGGNEKFIISSSFSIKHETTGRSPSHLLRPHTLSRSC